MKNSNIKTINGIGKACSIISLIAFIFCIVGFVGLIIADIAVFAIPTDKIGLSGKANATLTVESEDYDIGGMNFRVIGSNNGISINGSNDGVSIDSDKVDFGDVWHMDVNEVSSDGNSATYELTGDFADFNKDAVKKELFGKILEATFTVVLTAVTLFFARRVFMELAKCETPFTEAIVKKMKVFGWVMIGYGVFAGMNLTTIVAGLAVLMLGYVFAHGMELQRESDETL